MKPSSAIWRAASSPDVTPKADENPRAEAERRAHLDDAQHAEEAPWPPQVEDEQGRADDGEGEREVARVTHGDAMAPPAKKRASAPKNATPARDAGNEK